MHIALVNQWYPPQSGYGGVAMYNHYMGHALVALGHKVTVVSGRWTADTTRLHRDGPVTVYRLLNRDYYRIRQLPGFGRYWRPIGQLLYSRKVAHLLSRIDAADKVDIAEFAEVNAEAFFYLRRRQRSSVVVRCHTPTFVMKHYYPPGSLNYDTSIISRCEKYTIRRADRLTAPSKDMAHLIEAECALPPNRIQVIPNALGLGEFTMPEPETLPYNNSEIWVLHVGRLDPAKGIDTLVQAIPETLAQIPNLRFIFVGDDRTTAQDGARRAMFEAQLAAAGALDRVEFRGRLEQAELAGLYGRADICVVPSRLYESFSYTCAQGMAAGKPVVASRIGGIPETLDNGNCGILVQPGDANELADAIVRLAGDPDLRHMLGKNGLARAKGEFDAMKVAARTLELYQDVIRQTGFEHSER